MIAAYLPSFGEAKRFPRLQQKKPRGLLMRFLSWMSGDYPFMNILAI